MSTLLTLVRSLKHQEASFFVPLLLLSRYIDRRRCACVKRVWVSLCCVCVRMYTFSYNCHTTYSHSSDAYVSLIFHFIYVYFHDIDFCTIRTHTHTCGIPFFLLNERENMHSLNTRAEYVAVRTKNMYKFADVKQSACLMPCNLLYPLFSRYYFECFLFLACFRGRMEKLELWQSLYSITYKFGHFILGTHKFNQLFAAKQNSSIYFKFIAHFIHNFFPFRPLGRCLCFCVSALPLFSLLPHSVIPSHFRLKLISQKFELL